MKANDCILKNVRICKNGDLSFTFLIAADDTLTNPDLESILRHFWGTDQIIDLEFNPSVSTSDENKNPTIRE